MTSSYLRIDEETLIHYEISGDGCPIIFLHGFALDLRMWEYQVVDFSRCYKVVRYDMRGYGYSSLPNVAEPYNHADDLLSLIDKLEVDKVVVIGLSRGGTVAIDFVLRYSDRISALIVANAMPPGYPNPNYTPWSSIAQNIGIPRAKTKWLNNSIFSEVRRSPILLDKIKQMTELYSGWHWLNTDPGFYHFPDAIQYLESIKIPMLTLVGENDLPRYLNASKLIYEKVGVCERDVLASCGHMSNLEKPKEFNVSIKNFLDSVLG